MHPLFLTQCSREGIEEVLTGETTQRGILQGSLNLSDLLLKGQKSECKGRREYYMFSFGPLYQTQVSVCAEAARQNTLLTSVT